MTIEIKGLSGAVLFTSTTAADAREAVQEAIAARTNLSGSNLSYSNLSYSNLSGSDLRYSDLSYSNLRGSNLSGSNLSGSNLSYSNLSGSNLSGSDLRGSDLSYSNLRGSNLSYSNLRYSDLSYSNLSYSNLSEAKNAELIIAQTRILPDGDLIGWKRCRDDRIVKLRIPADAKRSHAAGRKCRAEYADVLEITDMAGIVMESAASTHDSKFTYAPGVTVRPTEPFDDDMWNECASGIHWYITRVEAENHA